MPKIRKRPPGAKPRKSYPLGIYSYDKEFAAFAERVHSSPPSGNPRRKKTGRKPPKPPARQKKKIRAAAKKTSASAYGKANVEGMADYSKIKGGFGLKKKTKKVRKDYVSGVGLKKKKAKKKMSKIKKALTPPPIPRLNVKGKPTFDYAGKVARRKRTIQELNQSKKRVRRPPLSRRP